MLVGNVADEIAWDQPAFVDETCYLLPAPTLQRPDLLTAVPTTPPDVDCTAALDLTDQDPTINQIMASLVLQVVRRMEVGSCPFIGLYLDMEQGTVTPNYATPEAVERVSGLTPRRSQRPSDQRTYTQSEKETRRGENLMLDEKGNATTNTTWQDNHIRERYFGSKKVLHLTTNVNVFRI